MKKLLVVALMLAMMLSLVGFAEVNVDVGSMSHEELVALFEKVQLALFGRALMDGVEIPLGKYVAGKDIPAGSYVINVAGYHASVSVQTWLPDGETQDIFFLLEGGESHRITLIDGMIINLYSIKKFTGKISIKLFAGSFSK